MGVAEPIRLYVPGSVMGFKRGKTNQHNSCSLLSLDGVNSKEETEFYMGKRVAFIYKAKTLKQGTRFRCIWGKITRAHGSVGSVQAKFSKDLPSKALVAMCTIVPIKPMFLLLVAVADYELERLILVASK